MRCTFDETKECIKAELFDKWKDDEKETAWLSLGVCPDCPIYRGNIDYEEVNDEPTPKNDTR